MVLVVGAYLAWVAASAWAMLHKDTDAYFFIVWVPPGPVILVWLILPATSAWKAFRHVARRRWRPALRAAIVPALAVATVLVPTEASVRFHFWTAHAAYDRTIRSALASGTCQPQGGPELDGIDCAGPVIASFPWGGFGAMSYGVVYDASDEIAREPGGRSAVWRARSTGPDLECAFLVEKLASHFYRVFSWGQTFRNGKCH